MPDESQVIDVVVEIPKGSRNKYEMNHETHRVRLDRVLHSSVHYPTDYGFVPETLAEDGDPLDALVIVEEGTFPGCWVPARPIGLLFMSDEHGTDKKLLCVAAGDPRFDTIKELADLAPHWLREIEIFFETYKQLEDQKEVSVGGWEGRAAAMAAIEQCRLRAVQPRGA
jgi:inorganic pyrophosphatase